MLYKICLKNLISDFFSFQPERKLKAGSGRTMGIQDNGRIKCIFSRKRDDYADEDEIFDLNEDHYLFLAKGKVDDRGKGYFAWIYKSKQCCPAGRTMQLIPPRNTNIHDQNFRTTWNKI